MHTIVAGLKDESDIARIGGCGDGGLQDAVATLVYDTDSDQCLSRQCVAVMKKPILERTRIRHARI